MFNKHKILQKTITLLYNEQNIKIVFNALEGNYALCLLGNFVHLCHIEQETTLKELCYPEITVSQINIKFHFEHYLNKLSS